MAGIVFVDGCTHYGSLDVIKKYWGSNMISQRPPGYGGNRRADSGYLDVGYLGYVTTHELTVANNYTWGMAVNPVTAGTSTWSVNFLRDNLPQCTLHYDGSQLHIHRGDYTGPVLGSSAAGIMPSGVWSYIEFYAYIHTSAGATEVRLNGSEVAGLTLTNQNTRGHATDYSIEALRVRNLSSGLEVFICDMVLNYGGPQIKNFLGDVVVDTIMPTADSNMINWTPVQGANIDNIDDDGEIDGDATYNYQDAGSAVDLFTTADLTPRPSSAILAVVANLSARKDDAAARYIKAFMRTNPSQQFSQEVLLNPLLNSSYRALQAFIPLNPETSNPWTESEVNGTEFGYFQE